MADETLNFLQQAAKISSKIMDLNSRFEEQLQKAVDCDLGEYGELSDILQEFLKAYHYKVIKGTVVVEDYYDPENIGRTEMVEDKIVERTYQGFAYTNSSSKPTHITGNTKEEIISLLQEWNQQREDKDKFNVCYIRRKDEKELERYDVKTGADITLIYLKLHQMSHKKFAEAVADLKSKGARYNPDKKAFYITKQDDLSLFEKYLPSDLINKNKNSVIDKLDSNKNKTNYKAASEYQDRDI